MTKSMNFNLIQTTNRTGGFSSGSSSTNGFAFRTRLPLRPTPTPTPIRLMIHRTIRLMIPLMTHPEDPPEDPPIETWGQWLDVRVVITSYSNWTDTNVTRYSLGDRERRQTRRGNRERVQRRTSDLGNTETRAIPHTPLIEQRWVSDPEPENLGRVDGHRKDAG